MRFGIPFFLLALLVVLTGCTSTRSISYHDGNENWLYRGELSHLSVIAALSAEGEVQGEGPVTIPVKGRLILIQSGQQTPDAQVVAGLSAGIEILPFSGIPAPSLEGVSWRQAARSGGVQTVVVYWGEVETSRVDQATKAITWIPLAGWIADEQQQMRVSIRVLVTDVATGRWSFSSVASKSTQIETSMFSRRSDDLKQLAELKQDAFARLGELLRGIIR